MTNSPESILKSTFGYDTFKPLQREIIANVQARRDTLVIMPTGGGKSLTYQVPALLFDGLTVVVSPLIALMKDQVEQLNALGVSAVFLNSSLSPEEYQEKMDAVKSGLDLEVAAAVTCFLLAGRYFEARARRRCRCRPACPARPRRQERRVLRAKTGPGGARIPVGKLASWATGSSWWRPIATDGVVVGALHDRCLHAHR